MMGMSPDPKSWSAVATDMDGVVDTMAIRSIAAGTMAVTFTVGMLVEDMFAEGMFAEDMQEVVTPAADTRTVGLHTEVALHTEAAFPMAVVVSTDAKHRSLSRCLYKILTERRTGWFASSLSSLFHKISDF